MKDLEISIGLSANLSLIDLRLCAKEFIDFIDGFSDNNNTENYIILTALQDELLVGMIIADKKSNNDDPIINFLPTTSLKLLFVAPKFRNKKIGYLLLNKFIKLQKEEGIAKIQIKLPQHYIKGIKFFQKYNFHEKEKFRNNIILERNIWIDFGIRDADIIDNSFY
ncbi:MAG: GNAT family N-acetyltransferase [Candidatus Lokiarchaeota archaeon]|nr:GNAT family N-acetyltransferase [Candidatus Lokiarchaeota archaeon]